jgi:8-oxo-dGTP pyrophosphatase MutT (NUDIX family)
MGGFDSVTAGSNAEQCERVLVDPSELARRLACTREQLTQPEDLWHQYTIPAGMRALPAAVLVPLVQRDAGVHVLLTHRTSHLHGHAGQISFPGGRVEAHDRHRQDTALRETEEEIGIARNAIEVLGTLPEYDVQTGYRITPVVGWITPPFELKIDPFEVQDAFEVPLGHFLRPEHYQRRSYLLEAVERRYLAVPYQGRYIWGATAAMLYSLMLRLRE